MALAASRRSRRLAGELSFVAAELVVAAVVVMFGGVGGVPEDRGMMHGVAESGGDLLVIAVGTGWRYDQPPGSRSYRPCAGSGVVSAGTCSPGTFVAVAKQRYVVVAERPRRTSVLVIRLSCALSQISSSMTTVSSRSGGRLENTVDGSPSLNAGHRTVCGTMDVGGRSRSISS